MVPQIVAVSGLCVFVFAILLDWLLLWIISIMDLIM